MQKLEISHQPAIICDDLPGLQTTVQAVINTYGDHHPLIDPSVAEQFSSDDISGEYVERRLTLPELQQMVDWEDTREPLKYPLIGEEAKVIISALGHQARQPRSWLQGSAANALESMGMRKRARVDRAISGARTVIGLLTQPPKHTPGPLPIEQHVYARPYTDEQLTQIKAMVHEVPALAAFLGKKQRALITDTVMSAEDLAA